MLPGPSPFRSPASPPSVSVTVRGWSIVTSQLAPAQLLPGAFQAVTVDPVQSVTFRDTTGTPLTLPLHPVAPIAPLLIVQSISAGLDVARPLPPPAPCTKTLTASGVRVLKMRIE